MNSILKSDTTAHQDGILASLADAVTNFLNKHHSAKGALAGAEGVLRSAQARYEASLDEGRDAARAARAARDDAELDVDIARREVEVWSARLDEAREAARSGEVEAAVREAERKRKLFEVAAGRHLPAMGASARALIRAWAEAEMAIEAARRIAGTNESAIPSAEEFRAVHRMGRKEIGRKVIQRWIHPRTREPLSDNLEKQAISQGTTAILRGHGGNSPTELTERVELERITYENGRPPIPIPLLIDGLSSPPIVAGGMAGWAPLGEGEHRPEQVLAVLDRLEHSPSSFASGVEIVTEDILIRSVV